MGGTSSLCRSSGKLYKVGTLAPPIANGFMARRHREAMQEPTNPERDAPLQPEPSPRRRVAPRIDKVKPIYHGAESAGISSSLDDIGGPDA